MAKEPGRRLSCMNPLEIQAIECIRNLDLDYDPIIIVKALRKRCIIDEQSFRSILNLWRRKVPHKDIYNAIKETVIETCSLKQLIKALYDTGFKDIVEILNTSYSKCKSNKINHIKRIDPNSRANIAKYFNNMKELVQDKAFKDDFSLLSKNLMDRISATTNGGKKMQLCDKFVALKAVEMDSVTNTTSVVKINHQGYQDIEDILNNTSNEALSRVILHSRYAIALSTTDSFEEAESCMRNARVHADSFGSCVEVTDMIYKSIVIDLTILENDPHNERFRKDILFKAEEGLWTLSEQEKDVRLFWKKAFLIRMAYAILGIGKSCRIIKNYSASLESLVQAENILRNSCLQKLEYRRDMLYNVAKARIYEFKGEYDSAISHIHHAKTLAKNGSYSAFSSIKEYEEFLINYQLQELDFRTNFQEHIDGSLLDRQPLMRLSSFESISDSSSESIGMYTRVIDKGSLNETNTADEDTEAKLPPSSSENEEETDAKQPSSSPENSEIGAENLQSSFLEVSSAIDRNVANSDFFPSLEHLRLSSFEMVPSACQSVPEVHNPDNNAQESESFPSLEHLHESSFENW